MIHRVPLIVSPRNGFIRTVGAPSLGTITDLAAIPGNGQIALSWTPAAHATSHQPQYRAQGSETWLSFGSPLSGTASGVTVTGLTPGTPYEARVVASDGVSQTFSNVVTATPTAPPATILAAADFEDGTIGPFSHHGHSGRGLYEIIPDPTGSGRGNVLHLIYLDPPTGSSDTESYIRWSPPQDKPITYGDTVYSYGQFYIVPNGFDGNRKLWRYYVGSQGGPGSDITIWTSQVLRVEGAGLFQNTQAPVTFGQWHTLGVQLTMNSAQGVQDGRFRVWLDGQQVFDENFDPLREGVGTLSSIRFGYQTQSTRDTVNLDDHRYWDNVVISTEALP